MKSRVINVILSLNLSDLNQIRLISDQGILEVGGAGVLVVSHIRRIFPYDLSYRSSLSLGERLQAELYDPDELVLHLANWPIKKYCALLMYLVLIRYPYISYFDDEAFRTIPVNPDKNKLTVAQRLEQDFLLDDPRDFAFCLINVLSRDRYNRLLDLLWRQFSLYLAQDRL
ncbi:hypothetical protein [Merismopedia glauca]|nr:hypothetical protein [Merismopedia glauca]